MHHCLLEHYGFGQSQSLLPSQLAPHGLCLHGSLGGCAPPALRSTSLTHIPRRQCLGRAPRACLASGAWGLRDRDGVRAWLTSGAWESRRAGRLSSSSPLLNNKIARPGSVPPSVAVSPRICYLPCLPCLYTPCTKELLRPTVGLLCLRQGLWIRTRKVLCCPRAGTRWRTFRTQRYSKENEFCHLCERAIEANGRAGVPVPGPMDPDPKGALLP